MFDLFRIFLLWPFLKTKPCHNCIYWSKGNLVYNSDYAGFNMLRNSPAMKWRCDTSRPYPLGKRIEFLTMNLSSEKNPTLYLSHGIIASFYVMAAWLITSGLQVIAQEILKAAHFVNGKFGVDLDLGNMIGRTTILNPNLSFDLFSIIIYWIRYILVTIFQWKPGAPFVGQLNHHLHRTLHIDSISDSSVQTLLPLILHK